MLTHAYLLNADSSECSVFLVSYKDSSVCMYLFFVILKGKSGTKVQLSFNKVVLVINLTWFCKTREILSTLQNIPDL